VTPTLLDERDYYPLLDQRAAPGLVIFTGPACGACRRLKAVLQDMAPPLAGLEVFEVNAEAAPGLVEALEVFYLPALFLYRDGDYHGPVHAELRADALLAGIVAAAAAPRQEPP